MARVCRWQLRDSMRRRGCRRVVQRLAAADHAAGRLVVPPLATQVVEDAQAVGLLVGEDARACVLVQEHAVAARVVRAQPRLAHLQRRRQVRREQGHHVRGVVGPLLAQARSGGGAARVAPCCQHVPRKERPRVALGDVRRRSALLVGAAREAHVVGRVPRAPGERRCGRAVVGGRADVQLVAVVAVEPQQRHRADGLRVAARRVHRGLAQVTVLATERFGAKGLVARRWRQEVLRRGERQMVRVLGGHRVGTERLQRLVQLALGVLDQDRLGLGEHGAVQEVFNQGHPKRALRLALAVALAHTVVRHAPPLLDKVQVEAVGRLAGVGPNGAVKVGEGNVDHADGGLQVVQHLVEMGPAFDADLPVGAAAAVPHISEARILVAPNAEPRGRGVVGYTVARVHGVKIGGALGVEADDAEGDLVFELVGEPLGKGRAPNSRALEKDGHRDHQGRGRPGRRCRPLRAETLHARLHASDQRRVGVGEHPS